MVCRHNNAEFMQLVGNISDCYKAMIEKDRMKHCGLYRLS